MTASAGELNPKDHVIYSWSGTGVTGNGPTATVDTSALAPGEYTITGTVKEGKPGREGMKPWETATCSAGLTVKAYEPPTISCSASPATIAPGGASTITATAVSPQNRPLTYSYTATAGTVTGAGPSAEYSSAGAPTGTVGITCNVSDDKGHTGSANTSLTIVAPVAPPPPTTQALCTISFATDKRRPMRVDNEAKACLDQVALDLKQQADAKAVLVGEQTPDEAAITAKQQERAAKHPRATSISSRRNARSTPRTTWSRSRVSTRRASAWPREQRRPDGGGLPGAVGCDVHERCAWNDAGRRDGCEAAGAQAAAAKALKKRAAAQQAACPVSDTQPPANSCPSGQSSQDPTECPSPRRKPRG